MRRTLVAAARTSRRLASAPVLAFVVSVLAAQPSAAAGGFGELQRFGARAEQGTTNPTRAGFLAGAPKAIGAVTELNYAIGVDPAEADSVFVLDEPLAPTEIETKTKRNEYFETTERHYRIQKFDPATGEETASVTFSAKSPGIEEEEPLFERERVSNIAVDPADGVLYLLVQEPRSYKSRRDVEAGVAYRLYAFSTDNLTPASGTREGVLADESTLKANSEKTAAPLIEPRGIAVDPSTHEVLILASEDYKGVKENDPEQDDRVVIQAVSGTTSSRPGKLGARYVDTSGFFKDNREGTFGVAVTPRGRVLVRYEGIAEIPASLSSRKPPLQLQGTIPVEPEAESVLQEATDESESGGQITVSPEEAEKGYPARLYEGAAVVQYKDHRKLEESTALIMREAETGAVLGWSGGQSPLVNAADECVLEPGTENEAVDVAAGSEGRLFVLAPEYLTAPSESFQPYTSKAVIELGPGGRGCPTARSSAVIIDANGSPLAEDEPVPAERPLGLSTEVLGADAVGQEWVIENDGTHAKVLEGPDALAFQREEGWSRELLPEPLFEYSFTEPGDYLITGKIATDDLATGQVETPARRLVVK